MQLIHQDNNNFTDNWSKRSAKLQNNIPAFRKNLDPIENVSVQRKVKNKALRSLLKQIKAIDDVVLENIGGNFQDHVTCEYVRLSSFLAKSAADNLKTLLAMRVSRHGEAVNWSFVCESTRSGDAIPRLFHSFLPQLSILLTDGLSGRYICQDYPGAHQPAGVRRIRMFWVEKIGIATTDARSPRSW